MEYAAQNVSLNITNNGTLANRYQIFVGDVRNIRRTPQTQKTGKMESDNLVNIDFSDDAIDRIGRFKMRADNFYLVGFQQGDTLYEAPDTNGNLVLEGSISLGFTVRHRDLDRITLSYESLNNAIRRLGNINIDPGYWDEDTQRAFLTVVLFVSESARFRWLSHHFTNLLRNEASEPVESWIIDLVKQWEDLSRLARQYENLPCHHSTY